jgi:hypothetical protein
MKEAICRDGRVQMAVGVSGGLDEPSATGRYRVIAGRSQSPERDGGKTGMEDCGNGFLLGCCCLIHDRATLFTREFKEILESEGVKTVRLPARSPNLNFFAERFVRSIKGECLDWMILNGGEVTPASSRSVLQALPSREKPPR